MYYMSVGKIGVWDQLQDPFKTFYIDYDWFDNVVTDFNRKKSFCGKMKFK